eukprot:435143-Pleurochrysis_carterae.AAC.1
MPVRWKGSGREQERSGSLSRSYGHWLYKMAARRKEGGAQSGVSPAPKAAWGLHVRRRGACA